MPAIVAAYYGYKALGGGDPTSAFKNDSHATPYHADQGATSYGGGQGGAWEPIPGEYEPLRDGFGQPVVGPDGKPVMAPKQRWVSTSDKDAAKYNNISAQYRGGAEADYLKGEEDRQRALQARGMQGEVANMALARARGDVPSIAEMQAKRDANRLAAEQSSIAASARGPAGLALAGQNQAFGSATGQAQISQAAQIAASQERERAEQSAFGMASGMRGQDYAGQGLQSQQAGQKSQIGLGYSGLESDVKKTAGQLGVQREAINAGQYQAAQNLNAQAQAQNTGFAQNVAMGFIGGGSSVGAAAAGNKSDARAKYGITPIGVSYEGKDTSAEMSPDGAGMDVMGTLKKYAAVPTTVESGPLARVGNGMGFDASQKMDQAAPGMMLSDDRTKLAAAFDQGRKFEASGGKAEAPSYVPNAAISTKTPLATASKNIKHIYSIADAEQQAGERMQPAYAKADEKKAAAAAEAEAKPQRIAASDLTGYQRSGVATYPAAVSYPGAFQREQGRTLERNQQALARARGATERAAAAGGDLQRAPTMGQRIARIPDAIAEGVGSAAAHVIPDETPEGGFSPSDERAKEDIRRQAPLANAARSMQGYSYAYKPEFTPPEQHPGEMNVGPVAQNMAKDPIARTVVKQDDGGILELDRDKLMKLTASIQASQQQQIDDQQKQIAALSRMKKRAA